jgi:hypothetical protein
MILTPAATDLLATLYAHRTAEALETGMDPDAARKHGRAEADWCRSLMTEQETGRGPFIAWIRDGVCDRFEVCVVMEEARTPTVKHLQEAML